MADAPTGVKKRRVTVACDFCARRNLKCVAKEGQPKCGSCLAHDEQCTFNRPVKKRGPVPGTKYKPRTAQSSASSTTSPSASPLAASADICPTETIAMLCQIYFDTVFPIFPYFHWPSWLKNLEVPSVSRSPSSQASLMALCAVASARARDSHTSLPGMEERQAVILCAPSTEDFMAASEAAFPTNLSDCYHYGFLRASALLAITSIHLAQFRRFHQFLGQSLSLIAINQFDNEEKWPSDLSLIEREELRRIFWSLYTLEVYSSTTFGTLLKMREAKFNVSYPIEVDDDLLGLAPPAAIHSRSWIVGWNFTTSLYRVLEHTLDCYRPRKTTNSPTGPSELLVLSTRPANVTSSATLNVLDQMQATLPVEFQDTRPFTGNANLDRFSFQAANIRTTMMTCKVAALALDDALESNVEVIENMLRKILEVPCEFLAAISVPFVHHVAGIGYALARSIHPTLSVATCMRLRSVLVALKDLLEKLEVGLNFYAGTADKIGMHINRIDVALASAPSQTSAEVTVAPFDATGWGDFDTLWSTFGTLGPGFLDFPPIANTNEVRLGE